MAVVGLDPNANASQVEFEVQRGAKFVVFNYCVSILIMTFKRASSIYFIKPGESAITKGLPFTLLSLVAGWWGIPWGPIYTIQSVHKNLTGGQDVTAQMMANMSKKAAMSAAAK